MPSFGKEEKKAHFMKIAGGCFNRFGFKKTTMRDIAYAAGKAKSSLYYYFKSKEEIIDSIVSHELTLLNTELNQAIKSERDPKEKLRTYLMVILSAVHKITNYLNVLKSDYYENYTSMENIRRHYEEEEKKRIKTILQYGIKQGVFVANILDILTDALLASLKGYLLEWAGNKDLPKLKQQMDYLLNIFLYGLVKR